MCPTSQGLKWMRPFLARPPISHPLNGQSGKKRATARRQEGSNRAGGNKHGRRGVMRELALTCQGRVAIPYNCIAPATMPYIVMLELYESLTMFPICRWPVAHNCFNCLSKGFWGAGNVIFCSKYLAGWGNVLGFGFFSKLVRMWFANFLNLHAHHSFDLGSLWFAWWHLWFRSRMSNCLKHLCLVVDIIAGGRSFLPQDGAGSILRQIIHNILFASDGAD